MANKTNLLGKTIGKYQVITELASNSASSVYQGERMPPSNRSVAIKLFHGASLNSPEERESFHQEVRFLQTLKHAHILPILDAGCEKNTPYLVREYASHGSLRNRIQFVSSQNGLRNFSALHEALVILSQIGQALQYVHQQHVVHYNLKPENILFKEEGTAFLTDFSLATIPGKEQKDGEYANALIYMAPEQLDGTICKESDQYALGCIAYELLTGRPLFSTPFISSLELGHAIEQFRQPTFPLPSSIEHAIHKATARDLGQRYADIWTFMTALTALDANAPLLTLTNTNSIEVQTTRPIENEEVEHREVDSASLADRRVSQNNEIPLDEEITEKNEPLPATILPESIEDKIDIEGFFQVLSANTQDFFRRHGLLEEIDYSGFLQATSRIVQRANGAIQRYRNRRVNNGRVEIGSLLNRGQKRKPEWALIITSGIVLFVAIGLLLLAILPLFHAPAIQVEFLKVGTHSVNPTPPPTPTVAQPTVRPTPKPTPSPTPRPTPTPTPSPTPITQMFTVSPGSFNALSNCVQQTNNYKCSATLALNASYQGNLNWYTYSRNITATFSPSIGSLSPGQMQVVVILVPIHTSCKRTGYLIFAGSGGNKVSVPWTC
jgi:serine/threonine protein kinase